MREFFKHSRRSRASLTFFKERLAKLPEKVESFLSTVEYAKSNPEVVQRRQVGALLGFGGFRCDVARCTQCMLYAAFPFVPPCCSSNQTSHSNFISQ